MPYAKIVIIFNIISFIEYKNQKDDKILKDLIALNEEMNKKYNTYDHFDKLKCVENLQIIEVEKKFENFSIKPDYDYDVELNKDEPSLPKINIDLQKLIAFFKNQNYTVDDLNKEIELFNQYFSDITKSIDLKKCDSSREKSIIYYLFYFISRCFFYICLHNNFMASTVTSKLFQTFFNNFIEITNSAKMCIELDLKKSSMIIDEKNNNISIEKKIKKKVNKIFYKSFSFLKEFPNEFTEFILRCHNFLSLILFSIDQYQVEDDKEISFIDFDTYSLFQSFVLSFNIIYEINEHFSILDYKTFYNEGISKHLNLRRDFSIYIKNEKIRRKKKKELKEQKAKESTNNNNKDINKENDSNKKEEKNKIDIDETESDLDLDEDDYEKNKKNKEETIEFTMFDYMWLFTPSAKNEIIRLFNISKQRSNKRKAFERRHHEHDRDNFLDFLLNRNRYSLTLSIRRENIIEDTLNELSKNDDYLQNELKIKFIGEAGVDQGGVRKEFFILLIRQIFDPNYGMFNYNKQTRLYWFNHYSFEPKLKYELIGTIFGLAIYNNTILDVKLPLAVYKKLLGIKPSLKDLKECDKELYNNLNYLLDQGSAKLEEELDMDFTVLDDKFGEKIIIPLKPDGDKIMINNINKEEYVKLFIDWYFNKSIEDFFKSFEKGFYKVFHKSLIKILSPEELELIICGTQYLDFYELKRVCKYDDYNPNSESIKYLWEILLDFNVEEKKKFLSFVTGCDRAPIDGLGSLVITVSNGGTDLNQLPTAHTCFNNLILPDYKDKEKMKKALLTAINYSEGFGLI